MLTSTNKKSSPLGKKESFSLGKGSTREGEEFRRERDPDAAVLLCPYCESKEFVKRGLRENKHRTVQLYLCKNPDCVRTKIFRLEKAWQKFTPPKR